MEIKTTDLGKAFDASFSLHLESAIPLMEENIALNASAEGGAVEARVLDWDQPLPGWVAGEPQSPSWPDVIMSVNLLERGLTTRAADVTYNTASFGSLLKTLTVLLKPKGQASRVNLILAYKEREPAERELWDMLLKAGVRMDKVAEVPGAEEEGTVEIWLGQAEKNFKA